MVTFSRHIVYIEEPTVNPLVPGDSQNIEDFKSMGSVPDNDINVL